MMLLKSSWQSVSYPIHSNLVHIYNNITLDSETAKTMMQDYHIGSLDEASRAVIASVDDQPDLESGLRPIFLRHNVWAKAILSEKRTVSQDTRVFRFKLDHEEQVIGLPTGQHLMMRLHNPVTREAIIRSYTPLSEGSQKGVLDILIKIYFDTKTKAGGKMTQALEAIPVGHFVEFKGPIGKFEFLGNGKCTISGKERRIKRFIMICAGTGITPIFQVLRSVLFNHRDSTKCVVLYGNRSEEDILCKDDMEALVLGREDKCKLLYTLTQPSETWKGRRGRIGKELIKKELGKRGETGFAPGEELVLICGPKAMEMSVHETLKFLGWPEEDLVFF